MLYRNLKYTGKISLAEQTVSTLISDSYNSQVTNFYPDKVQYLKQSIY